MLTKEVGELSPPIPRLLLFVKGWAALAPPQLLLKQINKQASKPLASGGGGSQHLGGTVRPTSVSSKPTWSTECVPGQPGLEKSCLKKKTKQNKTYSED